jgi:hypothetical protein
MGLVVELAADQLVSREGQAAALRVHETLKARHEQWPSVALRALACHPLPAFRGVFEAASRSSDFDETILGWRGLLALGESATAETTRIAGVRTLLEWYELWDWRKGDCRPPTAIRREQWLAEARSVRVVIVGEQHNTLVEQGAQIQLAAELHAAHGGNLVLLYELPVESQQPVILAARRAGIEVRALESQPETSAYLRDEEARENLKKMVVAEAEKRFLVIYGSNHLRSLQAAMRDVGVPAVAVVHGPRNTLLTDAIKCVGLRVHDYVFRYGDGTYYSPIGSYGAVLEAPRLDHL